MQVFISYSQKDRKFARDLSSRLSSAGLKVWLEDQEILPGDNWSLQVGKALERSNAMVVLLSPDAVRSKTVRREVAYALASPKYEGRVVPVVVRPTKDIPWFLQKIQLVHSKTGRGQGNRRAAEHIVNLLTGTGKTEKVIEQILGRAKVAHS